MAVVYEVSPKVKELYKDFEIVLKDLSEKDNNLYINEIVKIIKENIY